MHTETQKICTENMSDRTRKPTYPVPDGFRLHQSKSSVKLKKMVLLQFTVGGEVLGTRLRSENKNICTNANEAVAKLGQNECVRFERVVGEDGR
jgi:hypothetical protein